MCISDFDEANSRIAGVSFKELRSFPDERGFFREIIRDTDPFFSGGFAQWSHSKMGRNTVKAWHFHHRQIDWWYLGIGLVQAVLFDNRPESPTYQQKLECLLGEPELDANALTAVVKIPQGVLHGCKVLSPSAHLFYITSEIYNPEDEGRHPFDSEIVAHEWGAEESLIIAAKDRVTFIPPYERVLCAL